MATKVKTLYGADIYINTDSGKFFADVDGKRHESKNLKTLETTIRKAFDGIRVITLTRDWGGGKDLPEVPGLTKILRVTRHDFYGAGETRIWADAYIYDEGMLDVLISVNSEYIQAKEDFESRWTERWRNAKSELTRADYDQIAEQLRLAEQRQSAE